MEHITNADYSHEKRVCKDFETKNLGEYHDLYVQSDTSLLVGVFEKFEICALKYTILILQNWFSSYISMTSSFKKD